MPDESFHGFAPSETVRTCFGPRSSARDGFVVRADALVGQCVVNGACPPTAASLARVLIARARSRLAVTGAAADFEDRLWAAFREEIGTGVTRASPLLVALLDAEGLTLDDLAWMIMPPPGWPFAASPLSRPTPGSRRDSRVRFRAARGTVFAGVTISVRCGGRVHAQIVADSIEVRGRIGTVFVSTGSGMARLRVSGGVPKAVAHAAIGRPAAEVVDMPLLAGRDWSVVAVERSMSRNRSTFVVEVGSRPYSMPWAGPR